jgi:hypothetical protein
VRHGILFTLASESLSKWLSVSNNFFDFDPDFDLDFQQAFPAIGKSDLPSQTTFYLIETPEEKKRGPLCGPH